MGFASRSSGAGASREGLLEEASQERPHVLARDGPAPLDLVAHSLDEGARRGRPEVGGDQGLLELLEHRLVDGPPDGEDGVEALVDELAGPPQALPDAIRRGT